MSSSKVLVRVPATSANLGPGYDALGLALDLHDEVEAALCDEPGDGPRATSTRIEVEGEGAGELDDGEGHLIVTTMRTAFDRMGVPQPRGIRLRCVNRIPHARGLGSSSAAICAGILAARALAVPYAARADPHAVGEHGGRREGPASGEGVTSYSTGTSGEALAAGAELLSDDEVFALANELEGHPDNVAPCLSGGLTIAWLDHDGRPGKVRLNPHEGIRPVVCIPRQRLSTEHARGLLPKDVPHSDAAANAGRAALLVAALTQRPDPRLLLAATEDRLHQNYRAPAMPQTMDLVKLLRAKGLPAVVSGAGPTVLVFATANTQDLIAPEVGNDWLIQPLNVDPVGSFVQFPETR
ncbi:homoserine kinase [Thermopolyspora sp. NPDC052614]|uniref:homoserine kinase n=1 Tax=Thermopolyspora sp. NPDC052614 TaxID=3155682 RepID=UPI00342F4272